MTANPGQEPFAADDIKVRIADKTDVFDRDKQRHVWRKPLVDKR